MQHGIPEEQQGSGLRGMQVRAAVFPALTLSSLETSTLLHDARNMLGALQLYSDLLEEPGVLTLPHRHYASELRLIGSACRRLVERLALIGPELSIQKFSAQELSAPRPSPHAIAAEPVLSLAAELEINHSLLAALAGPAIQVNLTLHGGHLPIAMAREDLTRILVNLTRNAAQAMPGGGSLEIDLEETAQALVLTVSDTGPGIPEASLEAVFSPGYTTSPPPLANAVLRSQTLRSQTLQSQADRSLIHRGLGLAIVRSIVSAAGGSVRAAQHIGPSIQGAMILIEFPLPAAAHPATQRESAEACPTTSVSHPPI